MSLYYRANILKLTRYCYLYTGLLTLTFSLFEQETSMVPKCYLTPPDRVSYKCSAPVFHITTFGYSKPEYPSVSVLHLPWDPALWEKPEPILLVFSEVVLPFQVICPKLLHQDRAGLTRDADCPVRKKMLLNSNFVHGNNYRISPQITPSLLATSNYFLIYP